MECLWVVIQKSALQPWDEPVKGPGVKAIAVAPMPLMRFGGAWIFSPFQLRSATDRRETHLTTFLLSLVKVHLSNWVDSPF